jgi:hypothetical protein
VIFISEKQNIFTKGAGQTTQINWERGDARIVTIGPSFQPAFPPAHNGPNHFLRAWATISAQTTIVSPPIYPIINCIVIAGLDPAMSDLLMRMDARV